MWRLAILVAGLILTVQGGPALAQPDDLDAIARDYVRLQLEIGARDDGYVDAYYGPAEIRTAAAANPRPTEQLHAAALALQRRVGAVRATGAAVRRRAFLAAQLTAALTRLRMLRGERLSFNEEALGLYGVNLEGRILALTHYDPVLERIERLVRGNGPLAERVERFMARFTIPQERLDAVMRAAIAECRRRTVAHIPLPAGEAFTLEFVTDQPWSGYNWYQGNYHSLIQVNTDQPVRLSRAVDLGCHEGYPGHHAYNMLLERALARGRGWTEFQVYPLYSPQSFIAEGSANYGVELAFPGPERLRFETRILYPLAGLPITDAAEYLALQEATEALAGARFTIARDFLEGRITRDQAIALAERYQLMTRARAEQSIRFTERYRAYVINYGLGRDIVAAHVERAGSSPRVRWAAMRRLLSEPVLPADLISDRR
ncbi:MAG: hypothetical protein AB7O91_02990 [Sphingomonas sp.]